MMTKTEIQSEINSAQADLNTLNEVIETRGMLSAPELKNIIDSMNNRYKALLTIINESTMNEAEFTPTSDTNLFSGPLHAYQDVQHSLHGFQLAITDSSPEDENNYASLFVLAGDHFYYSASNSNVDLATVTEISAAPETVTIIGSREIYRNRNVYNSAPNGVSLQNATYQGTWTNKMVSGKIYLIDCFVTGLYNQSGAFLAYSGRFKGAMVLSSGTAVFLPSTYVTEESVYDPNGLAPTMSCQLSLSGDKVTLKHRNSKDNYPTIWKYEIQLRTL